MHRRRPLRALGRIGWRADDTADVRLHKTVLTYCTALITVLAFIWIATYWSLGLRASAAVPALHQVMTIVGLVVFWRTKQLRSFRDLQLTSMLVLPFVLQWSLGGFVAGSAVGMWALVTPLGALMFGASAVAWFVGFLTLLGVSALLEPVLTPAVVPESVRLVFFVLNLGSPALTAFVLLRYFLGQRDAAWAALGDEHRALASERARSERLLHNVLPAAIAERLKQGERRVADIADATVLFADLVGFTPYADGRPPEEVVELLNRVFTWMDTLADRFAVEKIKTVGDAYVAVAGLPAARPDHVAAIAELALALVAAEPPSPGGAQAPLRLRVGIDTGPVVAGVIGERKFSYDLWGDTVNTASRMETIGAPGRVHVTQRVVEALGERYAFEPRGVVDVKGKGPMPTWFLVGHRDAAGTTDRTALADVGGGAGASG